MEEMREIRFRGKTKIPTEELDELGLKHEDGWIYGHLAMHGKTPYIVGDLIEVDSECMANEFWIEVIPDTVGQYTGLRDEYDREIYEGDIVRCFGGTHWNGVYEFDSVIEVKDIRDLSDVMYSEYVEILGNKFENPELLGEDEE